MSAFELLNRFQPYLMPGERVLWSGQPKQGIVLTGRDTYLVPFSLMWGGFALFWNISVWKDMNTGTPDDWFFKLWGLPFLIAGLYFIAGRFLHDAWIRRSLCYAVTNQRALILRGRQSPRLTSREIRYLPMLDLAEHRDGSGTLAFDDIESGYLMRRRNGFSGWLPSISPAAQFFRIDKPRTVYELIRNQSRS
jgi:hypothetical protein